MKSVSKVLFIATMVFYPLSSPTLAMEREESGMSSASCAVKGTRAPNGYICVADERAPFPHADNPYKTFHTTLSDCFLEQHKKPSYQFPTSGGSLIELGEYRVDTEMYLGSGDDGFVYLARHIPTGIYAAAKRRGMAYLKEECHDEYKRLNALGQLYAAWNDEKDNGYLIIPFVDGKQVDSYVGGPAPWIKTTLEDHCLQFSDLSAGLRLIRSMADQIIYITQKGALHDQNVKNIMITNDYQNVVLVDFGASEDFSRSPSPYLPPFNTSTFTTPIYAFCCNYLLDIRKYLSKLKEGQIMEPSPIVNFLKVVSIDHFSLKLERFLKELEILETAMAS